MFSSELASLSHSLLCSPPHLPDYNKNVKKDKQLFTYFFKKDKPGKNQRLLFTAFYKLNYRRVQYSSVILYYLGVFVHIMTHSERKL